jgi:hypothetical protein
MQIGDKARWWNRHVRIGRISLLVLLVLVAIWITPYGFDASRSVAWGVSHKWTASYRGQSLKLPVMWRQEDSPNGTKTIWLRRARWGRPFSFEEISLHDEIAAPRDPEKMVEGLRSIDRGIGYVNTDIFVAKNLEVQAHYVCIASSNPRYPGLRIECVSKHGKWLAILDGDGRDIKDFLTILNNLSGMGDP